MKNLVKVLGIFIYLLGTSGFAHPMALPPQDPNFCPSFMEAAIARCGDWQRFLPNMSCDMNSIYSRMIFLYASPEGACHWQKEVDEKLCDDQWHCYLHGGKDSHGHLCSGTGKKC